jgi:hypothetical protein
MVEDSEISNGHKQTNIFHYQKKVQHAKTSRAQYNMMISSAFFITYKW